MKTIGELLTESRLEKNMTIGDVEKITKIRTTFISYIEREEWDKLPAFPTVLGFVKSMAWAIGLDEKMAAAVLKRDYPPKKLKITPKPDVANKFVWGPKITFAVGIFFIILLLVGYLGLEYRRFVSPPKLSLESPKENQVISGNSVNVFGFTDSDAKVTVNEQPVIVSDDGKFSLSLGVVAETKEITVQASSRSGKVTTVSRKITVQN